MYSESLRLEEEIKALTEKLKSYPEGNFYCTRDRNHYKWYHSKGSAQTYIPKSNRQLAVALAEKKYLSLKLKELIHEKRAIEFYLRHHSDETANHHFANHPEYHQLLSSLFQTQSKELSNWIKSPFKTNPKYAQNCIAKLQSYTAHGILPGINLITTYESKDKPLTSETIDRVIAEYFS